MNKALIKKISIADRKVVIILMLFVLVFVILTLTQDVLKSSLRSSAFYLSESLIFSSFWWVFAPLLFAQYLLVRQKIMKGLSFYITIILLSIIVHAFAYPFLVWILSKIFYNHTFAFLQTFRYTLSEYLYLLVLVYSIPVLAFRYFTTKTNSVETGSEVQNESVTTQFITTLVVSDGNKMYSIAVSEILYFVASPPYISIHMAGRKYLHKETLKSISVKLNPEDFLRVHKSTIVNIKMVTFYTTRLNGDYDVMMKNNVQLRISRNFAADFKSLFSKTHRLATK